MSLIKPVSPQELQTTIDQLDVAGYFERRKTPMVEAETDLAHAYSLPQKNRDPGTVFVEQCLSEYSWGVNIPNGRRTFFRDSFLPLP